MLARRKPSKRQILPLLVAFLASGAQAQLIQCIDSKGNNRYSETPCRPDERDPRKIYRRGSSDRKVLSHDDYQQAELARKEQERQAAARAAEEERRLKEMIRVEQMMREEAATAVLKRLQAEKNAAEATK